MLQEGMNATELRLDRSALVVNCSAAPNIKREYECMTGDPEVGCSTSSCRETPVPPSCLNAPEGLVRRKRSRLLTHVDWFQIADIHVSRSQEENARSLGRARESVRLLDQDSGLRTSASRQMVPASDAGSDIHWLSR